MAEAGSVFVVDSEQMVYELLERYLDDGLVIGDPGSLDFRGYPPLKIKMSGEHFHGTITPKVMKAFLELQKSIYKSYALAKYGEENVNRLTKAEKEALEIVVKVEDGSSLFEIDAQAILTEMVRNMSGEQAVAVILVVSAMSLGAFAYKAYLNNRKEIRERELTSEEDLRRLEQVVALSEQETKRMEIMGRFVASNPAAARSLENSVQAKDEMLSSFTGADSVEIDGFTVSNEVASELVKTKRTPSIIDRLDGLYRVLSVDSSDPLSFKIRVRNQEGVEFVASVLDETLDRRHKTLIQQAEWGRDMVHLRITAKLVSGVVREATVIGAGTEE